MSYSINPTLSNDLISKKISIILEEKTGNYKIVTSNVTKYPVGGSIAPNNLPNVLQEHVQCVFAGNLASEAPPINLLLD